MNVFDASPNPSSLTARELEVVTLFRRGLTSKEVAYELCIADSTVRVLLSRAALKLGFPRPKAIQAAPADETSARAA